MKSTFTISTYIPKEKIATGLFFLLSLLLPLLASAQSSCPDDFPSSYYVETDRDGNCRLVFEYPSAIPRITCGNPRTPVPGTTFQGVLIDFSIAPSPNDPLTVLYDNGTGSTCNGSVTNLDYHESIRNAYVTEYSPDYCSYLYEERMYVVSNRTGGSNADCLLVNEAPLPVEWISFEARTKGNRSIELEWLVADQVNNSHFEVQHSTDGRTYRTIQLVRGDGTLSGLKTFYHNHESPKVGKNYYRLRQVDYDGTYEFSTVVSAIIDDKKTASIFPNIIIDQDKIGIEINIGKRSLVHIHITDMNGRIIDSQSIEVDEGLTLHRHQLPEALPSGIYFLHLQNESKRVESHKFIKTIF